MKERTVMMNGRKKIVLIVTTTGVDKRREAFKIFMGPGWEYPDEKEAENRVDKEGDKL